MLTDYQETSEVIQNQLDWLILELKIREDLYLVNRACINIIIKEISVKSTNNN